MVKSRPDDRYEAEFWNKGKLVAGIDEAGRGPLAGPVVAASVILPLNFRTDLGINDSKKLTSKVRNDLFDYIKNVAVSWGIGIVDNNKIDEINILQATQLAMKLAVENMSVKPDYLLIDGNYFKEFGIPYKTIVKGDAISVSISAASILAKVTRDRIMEISVAQKYPQYYFEKHKGYGTKLHYECIDKFGICEIHRRSFLKNFIKINEELFANS
jgi:ribonuclease HII